MVVCRDGGGGGVLVVVVWGGGLGGGGGGGGARAWQSMFLCWGMPHVPKVLVMDQPNDYF